jgi:hypothetical protein
MKKGLLAVAMILVLGLTANVALTQETVVFPFFQHGWGCTTFWSAANVSATETATVTINMLAEDGSLVESTTGTVAPGAAWLPDTGSWGYGYAAGDALGFGNYVVDGVTTDCVYLWGCIYGTVGDGLAGFTLVLPNNPYGAGK